MADFIRTLEQLSSGELPIKHDFNEFVGHADVVRQLLEVAPDEIRDDLARLYGVLVEARDATGAAVLGVFPHLTDPELANVEGRISDFVAEASGLRLGDGHYEAGTLVGESRCPGWPGIGSPLTNNRFPYLLDTSASNYFSNRFWHGEGGPPAFIPVPTGGKVVFRGEYMRARYFAFHPCDFDTNTLDTLIDVDLDPDPGSANPFRGPVPDGTPREFTAQLVFTAKPERAEDREPNTSYVGTKRGGEPNPAVFNILRTTDSELGGMPPNSTGVLLPSVTVYDADGNQTLHFDRADPYPPGTEPPIETTHFAPLPIPDHRSVMWPGKFDVKSNWGLPYDLLASADIFYLTTQYSQQCGELMVIRAKALGTPHTAVEPVYTPGRDIRGFTITTYNFWAGICNGAVVDHEVAKDADGWFTLVVSSAENQPDNATPENGVTWINWGDYLDGQLTFRFLLRRDPMIQALHDAVVSGKPDAVIAPYVPRAVHGTKATFESGGFEAVFAAADSVRPDATW